MSKEAVLFKKNKKYEVLQSFEGFNCSSDYKGDEYQRIEYTPYGETWVEKTNNTGLEYLPYKFTGKEIDEETGLYYYGARYLDPKYSRWISTDPALSDYIPVAPVNNESRQHNSNLPGMGGIYNHINSNLYHYAGNNLVKYIDPDGNDIYSVTFAGVGAKLIVGGSVSVGIAWDDNENFALVIQGGAGVGIEAEVDLPGLSFGIIRDSNIDDLDNVGPFYYSADASTNGLSVDIGLGVGGVSFSNNNESLDISGGNIGSIGGGVNFVEGALYIKTNNYSEKIKISNEQKAELQELLIKNSVPLEIQEKIYEMDGE